VARDACSYGAPCHPDWQKIARDAVKRARNHLALQAIIKNNRLLFIGTPDTHGSNLKPIQFVWHLMIIYVHHSSCRTN
jgi:hypothetical protein